MKAVIFLHIFSFVWLMVMIWYIPNSFIDSTYKHFTWRFLMVNGLTLVPITIFIFIASRFPSFSVRKK
ncbi:hypothetical protein FSZ17_13775 [Cytobacillus dafuensis]|uniref:Uncharacterized protein n=1 Tax=Cytobacillus dafuensis TaxID=1742359 RepID=A0A5B8Z519_CYTDA|nr:hypothetical protein FSZ17_13775 [Cytobacillus dafuensis]